MGTAVGVVVHAPTPNTTVGSRGAVTWSRVALWLAVTAPFVWNTAKTASELAGGGTVGPLEMLRGGGPAVLWAFSIVLAPTVRRGVGAPEIFLASYGLLILMSSQNPGNPSPQGSLLKSGSMVFVLLALARLVRMYPSPRAAVIGLIGYVHVVLIAGLVEVMAFRGDVYTVGVTSLDDIPRLNLILPAISANPLALLGVAGLLSCVLGVGPRWLRFGPFVRCLLAAAYFYEIYLTRTRSGLALGLLILAIALLVRMRRKPLSSAAILACAVGGAILLLPSLSPEIHSYFLRGQTSQQLDSLTGRTQIWSAAVHTWHQHPVFGLGYYTGHRLGIPGLQEGQSNIDNTWLETLVDVGILGLVALALFALTGLNRLVRCRDITGDVRLWALAMAVYGLLISFINPTIQSPASTLVVLGVLLLCAGPRPKERLEDGLAQWMRDPAESLPPHGCGAPLSSLPPKTSS